MNSIVLSMAMTSFIGVVLCVAGLAAFIIMFITKVGLRDYFVANASKLVSQMFSCDFCLCWWTCLVLSIVAAVLTQTWVGVLAALVATPIARRLIQ